MSEVVKTMNYLKEFSEEEGIHLFHHDAPPDMPNVVALDDEMNIESFLNLAKSLDSRIIYYEETIFSIYDLEYQPFNEDEEDAQEPLEEMEDEKIKFIEKKLKALSQKWGGKLDSPMWGEIIFNFNGVSHTFEVEEPWFKEYTEDFNSVNGAGRIFDEKENTERFKKDKTSNEELKNEIEKNYENWCNVVAKDKALLKAKSHKAKMGIVFANFPELNSQRYYSIIDMIIAKSTEDAESTLRNEVYRLHDLGKTNYYISANLDLSKEKVQKMLAKERDTPS